MSNIAPARAPRAVLVWLTVVVLMIAAIVLVGGLTRLTDSGLSITEWKPVTGVIPPLSEEAWQAELQKYRSTTEYQVQNAGMSLEEFKTIFWWEWGHRLLARAIGMVVLLPLLWFWWRGALTRPQLRNGAVLFGLVLLQGALGWFMVVSGLVGRLDVSQYRLAAHLSAAFVIFGWAFWMLLDAWRPRRAPVHGAGRGLTIVLLAALFVQIVFGGLVAGLDAGLTYNTWPMMDGRFIPNGLMSVSPWWLNFGENVTTVQFQHRMLAYGVALLALAVAWRGRAQGLSAALLAVMTFAQVVIGIVTLLAGSEGVQPVALGAAHQLGALALVAVALWHLHALTAAPRMEGRQVPPSQPRPLTG